MFYANLTASVMLGLSDISMQYLYVKGKTNNMKWQLKNIPNKQTETDGHDPRLQNTTEEKYADTYFPVLLLYDFVTEVIEVTLVISSRDDHISKSAMFVVVCEVWHTACTAHQEHMLNVLEGSCM